ncbi:MAG TPA: putative Ig domain-containing protein [Chthonomonadaceae bacterium]|nr:putative Ig domain-containing protein [Chthonomonadaceae bacterium]
MITTNPAVIPRARLEEGGLLTRFPADAPLSRLRDRTRRLVLRTFLLLLPLLVLALARPAAASIAYGSINNFDTVNDTGVECHGFEIEIDDIHSKDITYTYDWNHYGTPKITEDNSDPLHPKVFVRYESAKNPDGTWAAYTAIPSGPISPTDGHQFTNPSVNFGGEHFGVGFYGVASAVKYSWLKDDGAGNLVFAGAVNISTPTFTYYPPAPAAPAQVQAVIVPPPPPELPVLEFGPASWVKVTVTQSHNNHKVEPRDLVSDDPDDPNDRNWKNGEPDEVEVEWQLLQTDFNAGDGGKNGEQVGAAEELPEGDEIITRRYDFYKYVGPIDPETGEALAEDVGPDGIHGVGDYADVVVVGDYIGAQMAGFDPAGQIGLIDHLQDGEVNTPYIERTIVVGGTAPIVTTRTGPLPTGMEFDEVTGILSGTPTESGTFTFTIHSTDAAGGDVSTTYYLTIVEPGAVQPLHFTVTTMVAPDGGGSTSGDGEYANGVPATVVAAPDPGFVFLNWTDGGTIVSTQPSYEFTVEVNRELVAHFAPKLSLSGISVSGLTTTGATVKWTTNNAADSVVEYGLTAGYGSAATGAADTKSHSVSLSSLLPRRLYHYRIKATDVYGQTLVSPDRTFVTALTSAPRMQVSTRLARSGDTITATLTVANIGDTSASSVQVTGGTLGSANTTTALPQSLGTIAAGSSKTVTLSFPGSVGTAGAVSILRVTGVTLGSTFTSGSRVILP